MEVNIGDKTIVITIRANKIYFNLREDIDNNLK